MRIGLTRHNACSVTLYHAVSYSDHQAGLFSDFRPPILTPPLLPQLLLSHPGLRCQSGRYTLSDTPWALTGSDTEEFVHLLYDQSRTLPIALITCPDLVSPSALCRLALGNLIVCWLDDPQVFDLLCDRLPQNLLFPWDPVKVFLPFSKGECFHPVLRPEDIQRMGGQEALAGIYRAYCTCPTGEERRAFIDLDVVYSLLRSQSITNMKEQIDQLRNRADQLEHENSRLHEQCAAVENARQALEEKLAASDIPTYDVLSIIEHPLQDGDLLEIEGCAKLQNDPRVICTADHLVVSGKALTEMLHEEKTEQMIGSVTIRRQTWEQLRESLDDWRCGRTQNLFNPIPRSRFVEAIARLDAERERLTDSAVMEDENHA